VSYTPVQVVEVSIWGSRVGAVVVDDRTGYAVFEYDRQWVAGRIELSPIHLPNRSGLFTFPQLSEFTYRRLPAMLADALPDRFGSSLLEAYLSGQGVPARQITPLDRLAYIGQRGMGALTFAPPTGPAQQVGSAYEIAELVAEGRSAVDGSFGTEADATAGIRQLIQIGSSAGGLRAKAVIAHNETTGEIRGGHIDAPDGFGQWIIKLDGVEADDTLGKAANNGRLEYAYYLMATAAGIDMSESQLLEEGGRAHFMTRRFDRIGNERVHTQTLCALAHLDFRQVGTHDYNELLLTIRELGLGADAERQAFRRAAFNVMAANRDDHTKNFSFVRRAGEQWALAPAYDLTFDLGPSFRQMSVNGNFGEVSTDDLLVVADRFGIDRAVQVVHEVADAVAVWTDFASEAGLPNDAAKRVASAHRLLTTRRPRTGSKP
jgi:serine/threonine-protein kinase HipA